MRFPPVTKVAGFRGFTRIPDTGPEYYTLICIFYQAVCKPLTSAAILNIIISAMKGRVARHLFYREFPVAVRKQTAPGKVHPGAVA
jgi:hypothetical protein